MLRIDPQDKSKLIDPLYKTGPVFYMVVSILLAIIGWGVFMYIRQIILGLGETGMSRPVFWGIYMVNFIFFIGISHAGTLISAILRVTGAEWRRPITRVAEAITVFALIVGTLQIIIDMGRPDRLLSVFFYGRLQSPILWDLVSVTTYFLASVTYLYLPLIPDAALLRDHLPQDAPGWRRKLYTIMAIGWRGNASQWSRLERAISIMAVLIIPIAVSVHTIISWILATTVQPGWNSTIFGPYFVVGAIFSGIGALFITMTAVRKIFGLEKYIAERQYRNLGFLFIAMSLIWAYFTFTEHMIIAAIQEMEEFPVLASKLWGDYSLAFWGMVALMGAAFWILVIPRILPKAVQRIPVLRPRYSLASASGATVMIAILLFSTPSQLAANLADPGARTLAWLLLISFLIGTGLVVSPWLKARPVSAAMLAAICVVVAMWLERWTIIIPTLTHPRLIPSEVYKLTMTEISITAASFASFGLMLILFFKLFPAVSIWEVAEGRVIDQARSKVVIPKPERSDTTQSSD
jgi:Ni/Fe-hydrogenase subunit HybB-like protein